MRTFVYSNAADMTHSLVHRVAQHMRARLAEVPTIRMAFLGGPPLPMFTALARERLDWSRVIVMLADEYVVPSISYDSHARLLRQTLLRDQAAKAQFEPIDVDGMPLSWMSRYQCAPNQAMWWCVRRASLSGALV